MRKTLNLVLLCLAIALVLPSCVSKKKFTELMDQKETLDKTLTERNAKIQTLEGDVENLQGEKANLESQNADLSKRLDAAEASYATAQTELDNAKKASAEKDDQLTSLRQAIRGVFASYANSGLTVTDRDDRLYVSLAEPILYRSGSIRLRKQYRDAIGNLAEILKANPDMRIQVEGHTDSKKMKEGARYMDNWELSTARAMAVVRELLRKGVPPTQLSAVGKGDNDPINGEDTAEARAQNRRAEIVVLPTIGGIYQLKANGGV
ncbi:MAG: OmpA family protein [Bacteroidota bacterium]